MPRCYKGTSRDIGNILRVRQRSLINSYLDPSKKEQELTAAVLQQIRKEILAQLLRIPEAKEVYFIGGIKRRRKRAILVKNIF